MIAALLLLCAAALLAAPHVLVRIERLRRSPRAALFVWQALSLSAVLFQRDGAIIQVVRDGVVDTRRVEVGLRNGQQAEITAGLQPGDEVVSVSGTFIRGGDRVVAVRAPGAQAAGAK